MDDNFTQIKSNESSSKEPLPLVSIGMPVYNGALYIRDALDSLVNQTFKNFELLISDNASTDETRVICQEYAARDDRIHYVSQPNNLGPSANFQYVLTEARGKYFMWAAHDDRWAFRFLEQTVAILEEDGGCGLAFSHYIERNLESGAEKLHQVQASNSKSGIRNYATRALDMCPSLIYGVYRIETVRNTTFGKFDFADVHFIAELALGTRIRVVNDYLYIAGTKGSRKPYSMTQTRINRTDFLRSQYTLLSKHFYFPVTQCLFILVCAVMAFNKIKLWRY